MVVILRQIGAGFFWARGLWLFGSTLLFMGLCLSPGDVDASHCASGLGVSSRPLRLGSDWQHDLLRLDAREGLPRWVAGHQGISRREFFELTQTQDPRLCRPERPLGFESAFMNFSYTNATRKVSDPKNRHTVHEIFINPLKQNEGYYLRNEPQWSMGFDIVSEPESWLAFEFSPRVVNTWIGDEKPRSDFHLERAYLQIRFSDWNLRVGRQELGWGLSPTGGIFWSNSPRPADMILLTPDKPFQFPWIFKHLGQVKFSSFLAHAGQYRDYPHAKIFGTKMSFRFNRFVELGFTQALTFGGKGSEPIKPWEIFREAFTPFKNQSTPDSPENVADGRAGAELRVRIPFLHNLVWSYETVIDDGRHGDLWKLYKDQVGYRSLFYWPSIDPWESTSLTVEYARFPKLIYRHHLWQTGYSLDERFIGDHFGPQTRRWAFIFRSQIGPKLQLNQRFQWLKRSNNDYAQQRDSANFLRVVPTTDRPKEVSWSWQPSINWQVSENLEADFDFGFERVKNYQFEADRSRSLFLTQLQLRYWF
ncbi:MAG: hypothetical protein EA369_01515 [Bradymonadales bacterium]|nr:MAG: hypothetical protein EA369_01515 [Bradymonadales bacterium]